MQPRSSQRIDSLTLTHQNARQTNLRSYFYQTNLFTPFLRCSAVICDEVAHRCVRMYVTKCHREQTTGPGSNHFGKHRYVDKVSLYTNFHPNRNVFDLAVKVKDSNRVHWEVYTWISRKRWQTGKTLISLKKIIRGLSISIFTFDLDPH